MVLKRLLQWKLIQAFSRYDNLSQQNPRFCEIACILFTGSEKMTRFCLGINNHYKIENYALKLLFKNVWRTIIDIDWFALESSIVAFWELHSTRGQHGTCSGDPTVGSVSIKGQQVSEILRG